MTFSRFYFARWKKERHVLSSEPEDDSLIQQAADDFPAESIHLLEILMFRALPFGFVWEGATHIGFGNGCNVTAHGW